MRLLEIYMSLQDFMFKGGPVMWLIAGLALLLWALAFERAWYLLSGYKQDVRLSRDNWDNQKSPALQQRQCLRMALNAELQQRLEQRIGLIKTLILLCPLLGLLGTVSGMISVFDVIAFTSMGDIKLMSQGVARATIPTLASMVVSISGIFAHSFLRKKADRQPQMISEYFNGDCHA